VKTAFVADSSLGVAWAVPAQSTERAQNLLEDVASGTPFFVPALWMFETANALLLLLRRKKIDARHCLRARHDLNELAPTIDDEGSRVALGRILDLAEEHGLSIYDATYLELALRKGLPLASRDVVLNKAAKRSGLKTLLEP
jgi:predicted nucleic acid-binding protein